MCVCVCVCVCVFVCLCVYLPGFLIRPYGTPNGTGRWPVAQCHDKIPHWCNSKMTWANIVNAVLDFDTNKYNSVTNVKYD